MSIQDDVVCQTATKHVDTGALSGLTCKKRMHPRPSYQHGTGKYQKELLELQALDDIVDLDNEDDRRVHWAIMCNVHDGLLQLEDNTLISWLRHYRDYNKQHEVMFKQITRKLKEWDKKALKALTKRRFFWRDPTPEEEEEHGLAIMDAVIMVGIERLRLLPLLPPEWRD